MRRFVVATALAVVLTGCGGGGDPKADPSPSQTVTTPASTTPSAPVMPEAAKADTKAGAVAFVKYYIELINHAQATGDTNPLESVESENCRSCAKARRSLEEIYSSSGHVEGGAWRVNVRLATRRPDVTGWTVLVMARFGPQRIVRSGGSTSLKGGRSLITFVVGHDASEWTVMQWSRAS